MLHRPLGRTGLEVSVLGYGSWGIGKGMWVGADDDASRASLRRAIEHGVNFLDTAAVYGDGHSEELVGEAVRAASEQVYVATKVPPKTGQWPARPGTRAEDAFPGDWIVESTERSLGHLGLETIDVQQFHVWSDDWVGQGDWLDAVERLKADGKIRFFGVSINDREPANAIKLIESGVVDTVQVIYNIFEQAPEDELFAAVQKANVGVIVRVPERLLRRRPQTGDVGSRPGDRERSGDPDRAAPRDRPALLLHASGRFDGDRRHARATKRRRERGRSRRGPAVRTRDRASACSSLGVRHPGLTRDRAATS